MKKSQLELDLDARCKELGFPDPDNQNISLADRIEIGNALARFYHGEVLYVDRRQPGHLKIYARPGKLPS